MNWPAWIFWALSVGATLGWGLAMRRERRLKWANARLQAQLTDSDARFDRVEAELLKLRRSEARDRILGIIEAQRSF